MIAGRMDGILEDFAEEAERVVNQGKALHAEGTVPHACAKALREE